MPTIALVSCVKQKRACSCAAREMYTSALFRKARAYAERHADDWRILSAKYGLLRPGAQIEPYEQTLKKFSAAQRRAWASQVFDQMNADGLLVSGMRFLWLAGMDYQRDLALKLKRFEQVDPLMGKRIGERLAWLSAH